MLRQRNAFAYTLLELVALAYVFRINSRPGGGSYKLGWTSSSTATSTSRRAADMRRSVFCCTFGFFNGNPSSFPAAPAAHRRCMGI